MNPKNDKFVEMIPDWRAGNSFLPLQNKIFREVHSFILEMLEWTVTVRAVTTAATVSTSHSARPDSFIVTIPGNGLD